MARRVQASGPPRMSGRVSTGSATSVLLPTCRAPSSATARLSGTALSKRLENLGADVACEEFF